MRETIEQKINRLERIIGTLTTENKSYKKSLREYKNIAKQTDKSSSQKSERIKDYRSTILSLNKRIEQLEQRNSLLEESLSKKLSELAVLSSKVQSLEKGITDSNYRCETDKAILNNERKESFYYRLPTDKYYFPFFNHDDLIITINPFTGDKLSEKERSEIRSLVIKKHSDSYLPLLEKLSTYGKIFDMDNIELLNTIGEYGRSIYDLIEFDKDFRHLFGIKDMTIETQIPSSIAITEEPEPEQIPFDLFS